MEEHESEKEGEELPGPPPDPSRIPSVVRTIGDLDVSGSATGRRMPRPTLPDIEALREFLEETEEPEPLSNNLSGDPMAESWLQLLLTLVVREHGQASMEVSFIEYLVGERMNREGIDLEMFLDRLWIMGRLEKTYGGTEPSYSPTPSWLEMK